MRSGKIILIKPWCAGRHRCRHGRVGPAARDRQRRHDRHGVGPPDGPAARGPAAAHGGGAACPILSLVPVEPAAEIHASRGLVSNGFVLAARFLGLTVFVSGGLDSVWLL